MSRKIFYFLFVVILCGCQKSANEEIIENSIAAKITGIKIADSLALKPVSIYVTKTWKDSLFYFTDSKSNMVYRVDKGSGSIKIIGRKGNARGEYTKAYALEIKGDSLFVSDSGQNCIHIYDLEGNYLKKKSYSINIADKLMASGPDNTEYFINYMYNGNYITASNGKSYFKQPAQMANVGFPMTNYSIQVHDSLIYFMNPYEMKIYHFNVYTGKERELKLNGTPSEFDWNEDADLTKSSDKFGKLLFEKMVICPLRFWAADYNGIEYYIVEAGNLRAKTVHLFFFKNDGELIQNIKLEGFTLFSIKGNKMAGLSLGNNSELKAVKEIEIPDSIINGIKSRG